MRSASITCRLDDDQALEKLLGALGHGGAAEMVEVARRLPGVAVEDTVRPDADTSDAELGPGTTT